MESGLCEQRARRGRRGAVGKVGPTDTTTAGAGQGGRIDGLQSELG